MIKLLGPMIRSSCSSFEAAHQYFEQTARKQNFKNLPLSLAKRHQLLECSYFGLASENFNSHSLFSSEWTFGVLQSVGEEKRRKETTCVISSMNQHYFLVLKIYLGFTKQIGLFYLVQNTVKNALLQLVVVETHLFQNLDQFLIYGF